MPYTLDRNGGDEGNRIADLINAILKSQQNTRFKQRQTDDSFVRSLRAVRLRRVTREDEVAAFDRLMAGEALTHACIGRWCAVLIERRVPPTTRRGILF